MVLSLNKLLEDGVPLQKLGVEPIESAEDSVVAQEDKAEWARLISLLPEVLIKLPDKDKELIELLYFKNIPIREYARQIGVTHRAIIKRRNRILSNMKKI